MDWTVRIAAHRRARITLRENTRVFKVKITIAQGNVFATGDAGSRMKLCRKALLKQLNGVAWF